MSTAARRAIGIVRVSQVSGRDGESFASPGEQADRIRDACERDGLALMHVTEELDVSGGTPLAQREGLRTAVEAVEAGEADVLVAAYFDRLVRSVKVQAELVERVEAAGGSVLALDTGQVTNGSAGQWLSATMLGAVSEYVRRSGAERSRGAQVRAVERGVWMSPYTPVGYRRDGDGRLEVEPTQAPLVAQAFALRASGASVAEVFEGVPGLGLTYASVGRMLRSRAYLGEVHFGELANLQAHPPLVDAETFRRAQGVKPDPGGRKAKSERLLARLGVLRCGSCGGRMSATTGHNGNRPIYRCGGHVGDTCTRRLTIGAEMVEEAVAGAVREVLANDEGRASRVTAAREAEEALARAQAALASAIRTFAGFEDEEATRERLAELREERDEAEERAERLGGVGGTIAITALGDWERLTFAERRDLITAVVESAVVAPGGRGLERLSINLQ